MLKWSNVLATASGALGTVGMQMLCSGSTAGVVFILCGGLCFAASLALDK